MFETIEKSIKFLENKENFFILSCDCFGNFNDKYFRKFVKVNDPDIILFPFKISDLQKTQLNSHTTIEIVKSKLKSINVKKFTNNKNEFGHAGFFWVKNNKIFNYINKFNFKMKFNREILLDDYFKFLFDEKIYNVHYFMLDDYIHIGSINEYLELKYWENYFTNENS
jgi:NDP-sugar pyrophosphorylase family protein